MEYRTIGYVAGTHGIKGEIRVKVQTDFVDERFAIGACVYLEKDQKMFPFTIESVRPHKGMLLVKMKEIFNLNEVEDWKSCRLCVSADQLHELDEDEIYYHDLLNMRVVDEADHELGHVSENIESGAHAIIRVKGEKELLIPYVKSFIIHVDVKEHVLVARLIEGML